MVKHITEEQFRELVRAGRKLAHATLYERQDYMVDRGAAIGLRPMRDVTDEPLHHGRAIKPPR